MNGVNRADCALVDTWLDDWLAGRLDAAAAHRIEQHVSACPRCGCLAAIVQGAEGDAADAPADDRLLSRVLDRTTGSPCARSESLLPSFADGELDAGSREVLEAHLANCDGCSRLLAALQEARDVLPTLAEIEPPIGFTQRVLAATTAAPAAPVWWRLLARPRASLELAYVVTVLLVVLLGNPVAAFHRAEARASEMAGAARVGDISEQLGVAQAAQGTIGRFVAGVTSVFSAIQTEVAARLNQARAIMQEIQADVTNAIAWLTSIDVKQILGGARPAQPRGQPAAGSEPGARR